MKGITRALSLTVCTPRTTLGAERGIIMGLILLLAGIHWGPFERSCNSHRHVDKTNVRRKKCVRASRPLSLTRARRHRCHGWFHADWTVRISLSQRKLRSPCAYVEAGRGREGWKCAKDRCGPVIAPRSKNSSRSNPRRRSIPPSDRTPSACMRLETSSGRDRLQTQTGDDMSASIERMGGRHALGG